MLLDSALAQAEATAGGELLHSSMSDLAAAYLFRLCSNHPFVDGDKRVAFAAMETFLRLNGNRLDLSDDEAYALAMSVASAETNTNDIAELIRERGAPA